MTKFFPCWLNANVWIAQAAPEICLSGVIANAKICLRGSVPAFAVISTGFACLIIVSVAIDTVWSFRGSFGPTQRQRLHRRDLSSRLVLG